MVVEDSRPGHAFFVPPPPHVLADLLGTFEKYVHAGDVLPGLVRVGLLHVQFESIHLYLDGNGRIGRLLIRLLLEQWELLSEPLLYLSLFFKRHRSEYYRRLGAVRTEGDWGGMARICLRRRGHDRWRGHRNGARIIRRRRRGSFPRIDERNCLRHRPSVF